MVPGSDSGLAAEALAAGFARPVFDAQRSFRQVLEALSYPGRIVTVDADLAPPAPLGRALGAMCLTLLDYETPVWLGAGSGPAADWLRFHCGCPLVAEPRAARFALVPDASALPALTAFSPGEDEYPDSSATLLVEVEALGSGASRHGTQVRLTGPGIREAAMLAVAGLPERFWADWRANGALFPCGVDVILAAGDRIVGLPRTVRAQIEEEV